MKIISTTIPTVILHGLIWASVIADLVCLKKPLRLMIMQLPLTKIFSSAYFNKANSLAQLEQYDEAIAVYKETFKHEEHEPTTYYYIGECYENLNRFEEALVNYNKCVKLDPANADAWLGIGVVLDAMNRLTEGVHYVKKAIEINPNDPEYWYVFAEVQENLVLWKKQLWLINV